VPFAYLAGAPQITLYHFHLSSPILTETSIVVPITQSVCNIWLNGYGNTNPGSWILCPFGAAEILLTGEVEIITIVALLLFIIPIVMLGNAFCSWACPIGTMIDSFDKSVEKFLPKIEAKRKKRALQRRNNRRNKQEKNLLCPSCPVSKVMPERYGVLANGVLASAFVGSAVFRVPVFCVVCPIGISTRGLVHLRSLSSITGRFLPFVIELLPIPIIAVLLSLREKRFWCKKLCPVGSLLRATGRLSPFLKLRVEDKKCVMKGCPEDCEDNRLDMCLFCRTMDDRSCEQVCPVDINLVDHGSFERCTRCLECYIVCDHDAVKINILEKPNLPGVGGFLRRLTGRRRKNQVAPVEN
jgi:hypothetical protein